MTSEWRECTLGDVIELKRGYDLPQQKRRAGKVPIVSSSGISDFHDESQVKAPGVVTGRYGTLGQVFFIEEDFWPLNTTLYVRDFKGNDPRFISYFLRSIDFLAYSDKAAVPGLNRNHLHEARVRYPTDKSEQRAIARILGNLDDKIELNRRTSATLEAMARAIFEQAQQAEDWKEVSLGSIADIYDGPHATPKLTDTGPTFLGIANLANGQLDLSDTKHLSDEDFVRWTRRITPSAGDVVFSYETRLGQAALIPSGLQCCLGRRMGLLRVKRSDIAPVLLLRAYLSDPFQETIRARTIHGSTVDRIPLKDMGSFPIRLPQGQSAETLSAQLVPLQAKLEANQRENQTLATLRDTLLPKLLSGEIRVKENAELLEQAIL